MGYMHVEGLWEANHCVDASLPLTLSKKGEKKGKILKHIRFLQEREEGRDGGEEREKRKEGQKKGK